MDIPNITRLSQCTRLIRTEDINSPRSWIAFTLRSRPFLSHDNRTFSQARCDNHRCYWSQANPNAEGKTPASKSVSICQSIDEENNSTITSIRRIKSQEMLFISRSKEVGSSWYSAFVNGPLSWYRHLVHQYQSCCSTEITLVPHKVSQRLCF